MNKVIYNDLDIIGYSNDIIVEIYKNIKELDEELTEPLQELLDELKEYDNDLVICHYYPMGTYFVNKLIEE